MLSKARDKSVTKTQTTLPSSKLFLIFSVSLKRTVSQLCLDLNPDRKSLVGATVSDFGLPWDLLAEIDFLV